MFNLHLASIWNSHRLNTLLLRTKQPYPSIRTRFLRFVHTCGCVDGA